MTKLEFETGMIFPKKVYLKKINYFSKLPSDFKQIVSVKNKKIEIVHYMFNKKTLILASKGEIHEAYYIEGDKIYYFNNKYRFWIVRILQRLYEVFFPKVYEIEYFNV